MSSGVVPSPIAALKREIELWAGLIFLVFGFALFLASGNWALSEFRFVDEAVSVRATVVDRSFVPADKLDHRRTVYLVVYRYATPEGDARENSEEVSVERWEALAPGMEFDLALAPGFEPRAEDGGLESWLGVLIPMTLGALFTAFGAWFGIPRAKRALRLISAYRRGVATPGEVVEIVGTSVKINRTPMVRMRFRFRDQRGAVHEGETGLLYPEEAASLQPGSNGTVRYDPSTPGVSVWIS